MLIAVARWLLLIMLLMGASAVPAVARQATPLSTDAPVPIAFPRDDGPHPTAGIEWWYFTGHLETTSGEHFGFEYVVFRARPGGLEGYVAHFAISDDSAGVFRYEQRAHGARGVSSSPDTLDLTLDGWTMKGSNGVFTLHAAIPEHDLNLDVASTKPAALHDGDGYIDYGNGTATYYYSWTRMTVGGTLNAGGKKTVVTGTAWMDHQWGDFTTYQNGGWDWFAVQLDNGIDVMVYLVRGSDGSLLRVDGSIVAGDGKLTMLRNGDFVVSPLGEWQSSRTNTAYPSGWTIAIPSAAVSMTVSPTMADQELDTRATTGVIYWEGEALVSAMVNGKPANGRGYVELTGYAPFEPPELPRAATPAA